MVSPRFSFSSVKSRSIRITPGLNVITTPVTPVTMSPRESRAMRRRFCSHVSYTTSGFRAVHSRYAHPSNGQAFQSRNGSFGAGITFDSWQNSGAATAHIIATKLMRFTPPSVLRGIRMPQFSPSAEYWHTPLYPEL
jgi:hypothetical protein